MGPASEWDCVSGQWCWVLLLSGSVGEWVQRVSGIGVWSGVGYCVSGVVLGIVVSGVEWGVV